MSDLEERDVFKEARAGFYFDAAFGTAEQRRAGIQWLRDRAADSDHPLAVFHEGHHYGQQCTAKCAKVGPGGIETAGKCQESVKTKETSR